MEWYLTKMGTGNLAKIYPTKGEIDGDLEVGVPQAIKIDATETRGGRRMVTIAIETRGMKTGEDMKIIEREIDDDWNKGVMAFNILILDYKSCLLVHDCTLEALRELSLYDLENHFKALELIRAIYCKQKTM